MEFRAGRIIATHPLGEGAEVEWQPRGSGGTVTLAVRRIVNCTGPQADIGRAGEPLLDALLGSGRIRPDPLRIGVAVDAASRTLDAAGEASDRLYAVGPITRGTFWEIVAVPEIRNQVRAVAERLTGP